MESRDLSLAQMCGNRCKSIRMVKGMTQQELAEKLNVTAAAVSKWEKEGVSNIDQIKAISDALGQDIAADQFDQEGTVGAVGSEILSILVMSGGFSDYDDILAQLYGMKADRFINELAKLERIGTLVREQYTDYNSIERDVVFITAKGVIVSKNSNIYEDDILSRIKTIDQMISDKYSSIQDIVDNDKVTALLFTIGNEGKAFRCDYIFYLMHKYFNPGITNNKTNNSIYRNIPDTCELMVGNSAYIDILDRMIHSTNRKEIDIAIEESRKDWGIDYEKKNEEYVQLATGLDNIEREAIKYFKKWILPWNNPFYDYDEDEIAEKYKIENGISKAEREKWDKDYPDFEEREENFFDNMPEDVRLDITKWFSDSEIREFIEDNYLPPKTETEKEIDNILHKIWEADESTLDYYYSFPKRWEDNGLAGLIREKVGVPERKEKTEVCK